MCLTERLPRSFRRKKSSILSWHISTSQKKSVACQCPPAWKLEWVKTWGFKYKDFLFHPLNHRCPRWQIHPLIYKKKFPVSATSGGNGVCVARPTRSVCYSRSGRGSQCSHLLDTDLPKIFENKKRLWSSVWKHSDTIQNAQQIRYRLMTKFLVDQDSTARTNLPL